MVKKAVGVRPVGIVTYLKSPTKIPTRKPPPKKTLRRLRKAQMNPKKKIEKCSLQKKRLEAV